MMKLCASSVSKPWHIIFKNCSGNDCFPKEREKPNVVPVSKKSNKELINNYRQYRCCQSVLKFLRRLFLTLVLDT